MADGMHQMRVAHADAAIQEEWIVGARRALSNSKRSGAGELIAIADDERVERVARVELRGRRPVELALLRIARRGRRRRGRMCWQRREAAVFALRRNRWILLRSDEADVIELQRLKVDGLLNEIAVLVADVLELRRRHAHVKRAASGMRIASGLEPSFEGLAYDLFFQGREDLEPGIENRCR